MVYSIVDGYEGGVPKLRSAHDDDCAQITKDIFAHYYINGRNILAIKLIVRCQKK